MTNMCGSYSLKLDGETLNLQALELTIEQLKTHTNAAAPKVTLPPAQ